jgi:hypothetical protein
MKTGKVLVIGCARREGRWEVKKEMEMAGMTLLPQTALQCVTKEEAAGEFVYSADTYTGTMRVKSQGKEMTMKYAGKRLGDCTK